MFVDIDPPSGWGNLRGFALTGDTSGRALAAGKVRVYLVPQAQADIAGTLGTYLGTAAAAASRLDDVTLSSGLSDITASARAAGVTPRDLAPPPGADKTTLPTRILALEAGANVRAFLSTAMDPDAPGSQAGGHLHCLVVRPDGTRAYAQSALSGLSSDRLETFLTAACGRISEHLS